MTPPFTSETGANLLNQVRAEVDRFTTFLSEWNDSPLRLENEAGGQLAAARMLNALTREMGKVLRVSEHIAGEAYEWASENRSEHYLNGLQREGPRPS